MNGNWYALRWKVLNRDNFTCQYCGQSAPSVILHVDHKIAKALGGTDSEDNLITACSSCNIGKNLSQLIVPSQSVVSYRRVPWWEKVIDYLRMNGEASATELGKALNIERSRANIAHMLANDSRFIKTRVDGKRVYYALRSIQNGK